MFFCFIYARMCIQYRHLSQPWLLSLGAFGVMLTHRRARHAGINGCFGEQFIWAVTSRSNGDTCTDYTWQLYQTYMLKASIGGQVTPTQFRTLFFPGSDLSRCMLYLVGMLSLTHLFTRHFIYLTA